MTSRPFTLARLLLRLYPRRWRERYAEEMLALLEETGVTWRVAIDLARGAIRERAAPVTSGRVWPQTLLAIIAMFGYGTIGALLGVAAIPMASLVAPVLPAPGSWAWEPLFAFEILAVIRALPVMSTGREPEQQREWAISNVEAIAWAIALFAVSLVSRLHELEIAHAPGSSHAFHLSWSDVFAQCGTPAMFLASAMTTNVARAQQLVALRKAARAARVPTYPLGLGPTAL